MNKIIYKTALITVAVLAAAALIVFSLWILCSPQSMATACERSGNYSFAVTCADLRYNRTKDVNDLARCAEDSILSGKDKYIVKYGEKLIADDNFPELCVQKDASYSQSAYGEYTLSYKSYICGHLSAAEYRSGDIDKAIAAAVTGESFTKLVLEIADKNDKDSAEAVSGYITDTNLKAILENVGE